MFIALPLEKLVQCFRVRVHDFPETLIILFSGHLHSNKQSSVFAHRGCVGRTLVCLCSTRYNWDDISHTHIQVEVNSLSLVTWTNMQVGVRGESKAGLSGLNMASIVREIIELVEWNAFEVEATTHQGVHSA